MCCFFRPTCFANWSVFSYPRVRAFTRLTDEDIALLGNYLHSSEVSALVYPGPAPRIVPSDPHDDPIVHLAIVGKADVLCTLNTGFHHSAVVDYCRVHGVRIVVDIELLELLRQRK